MPQESFLFYTFTWSRENDNCAFIVLPIQTLAAPVAIRLIRSFHGDPALGADWITQQLSDRQIETVKTADLVDLHRRTKPQCFLDCR